MMKLSDKELWTKMNEPQPTRTVQRSVSLPDGKELAHCMYLHPKYREVIDQLKGKLINTLEQDDQARGGFEEILENQGIKIQDIIKSDPNNQERVLPIALVGIAALGVGGFAIGTAGAALKEWALSKL